MYSSRARGEAEIITVVLIFGFVVTASVIGFQFVSGVSSSTEEQLEETEFEITDAPELEVTYRSSRALNSPDVTRVYTVSDGERYTIYDGEQRVTSENGAGFNGSIEEGDVVLSKRVAGNAGIEYGDSVRFVIETSTGESYVADTVSFPPRATLAGRAKSNGSVSVSDDTNLNDTVQLETSGG